MSRPDQIDSEAIRIIHAAKASGQHELQPKRNEAEQKIEKPLMKMLENSQGMGKVPNNWKMPK